MVNNKASNKNTLLNPQRVARVRTPQRGNPRTARAENVGVPPRRSQQVGAKATPHNPKSAVGLTRKLSGRAKKKLEPWEEERLKGAKIYKLSAYTTTDNINNKYKILQRQNILWKVLVSLMIIIAIFIFIGKNFDLSSLSEWELITGAGAGEGPLNIP